MASSWLLTNPVDCYGAVFDAIRLLWIAKFLDRNDAFLIDGISKWTTNLDK